MFSSFNFREAEQEDGLACFLQCYHLKEAKDSLREIQHYLFTKNYPHRRGSQGHDDVLFFFEKMEGLIEAAYGMRELPAAHG